MAKGKTVTGQFVVVNPDGSRHIVPAANEKVFKGYQSKLPADKQAKMYPYEEGKAIEDYGKGGKTKGVDNQDTAVMIESLVSKMNKQEAELEKLRAQVAGGKEGAKSDPAAKKTTK